VDGVSGARTELLGQFTDEHAEVLLDRLEAAGIEHWVKRTGAFTRLLFAGDWGTRIFIDVARRDEARQLADEVLGT